MQNLVKAIDGLLVFSAEIERVFNSIFDNRIPELWQ